MRRALILVAVCVALGASLPAHAADAPAGPSAAIASPAHASVITGERARVTALFEAGGGALVNAAELYVDGELHDAVAVSPPQAAGSCKLTWYCGEFAQGEHVLTARVYDSSGRSTAVDVAVTLQATRDEAGRARLEVRIVAPREGQTVSGPIQVRVAVDESRVRYVMLLIDDAFVALTNMPPFAYEVDTTRYLNGLHALRATAFDQFDRPHDSPIVNVLINNPGGRTEMRAPAAPAPTAPAAAAAPPSQPATTAATLAAQTDTGSAAEVSGVARPAAPVAAAPSAAEHAPAEPVASAAPAAAEPTPDARSTAAAATMETVADDALGATAAPQIAAAVAPSPQVSVTHAAVTSAPAAVTPALAAAPATASGGEVDFAAAPRAAAAVGSAPVMVAALPRQRPAPPVIGEAAATPAAMAPAAALALELALPRASESAPSVMSDPELTHVARAPSAPVVIAASAPERGDIILHAVAPGEQLASVSARYGVPADVIARFNRLRGEALAAGQELRIPFASRLMVNGEPVYSDVPVMSEAGITLAPFRAIVEHSGGVVHWIPAARQVRAVAFSRDIRVTVGSRQAVVDSAQYTLESEARLLRDRALVPLGLFRDALGFDVTYDQGTGRIYLAAR